MSVRSRASSHRLIQLCSNLLHYCPDRLSNALSHGFNDVSPVRQPSSTGPGQHAPPVRRPRTASNDEVPGQIALTGDFREEMTPTFGNIPYVRKGGFEPPRPFGHWHLKPARLPFRHLRVVTSGRHRTEAVQS